MAMTISFVVVSGAMLLEAQINGEQRRTMELLFPGDVLATMDIPRMPRMLLVAATSCDLVRYTTSTSGTAATTELPFVAWMQTASARRNARRMIHMASVSQPLAEHRLGDFLVETGLYLGHAEGARRRFNVPFAREQIASYLALNPDTLSRLFTRFKQRGLIVVTRGQVTVPCWPALCHASPLAEADD
ncbi:MAG: Crp/Fnr family transcriptional regulator [Verrucomicrobiae bacterium]|nr:Crp/Fnr family transcriptional regulator [Verrucomicrobiae bacterium]